MQTLFLEIRGKLLRRVPHREQRSGRAASGALLGALAVLVVLHPWAHPQINVEPQRVAFGGTPIGSPSETQTIAIGNTGSATLHLGTPLMLGDEDFSFATDCGQGFVEPGRSCHFDVHLTPKDRGERVAFLTLPSDGSDQPIQVPLVGSGTAIEGARLEPDPPFLDFEQPSTDAASMTVALRNTGEQPAEVTSIATDGPSVFSAEGCEGKTLASGESCVVTIDFRPDSAVSTTAWLVVGHDSPNQELRIPLRGVAFLATPPSPPPPPGRLGVNPRELYFKGISGHSPADVPLEISNQGEGPLQLLSTDIVPGDGPFVVHGGCAGRTLATRDTCVLSVGLGTDRPGQSRGSLTIRSDDRTIGVPLVAEIREPGRPRVSVLPRALLLEGGVLKARTGRDDNLLTLTNDGDGSLQVERYEATDTQTFIITEKGTQRPCREGQELSPGEWCQLRVFLRPGGTKSLKASLLFYDNADNSPQRVPLLARWYAPELGNLDVGSFDPNFGPVAVAAYRGAKLAAAYAHLEIPRSAPTKTISLVNRGPGPLTITISDPSDPDFRLDRDACENRVFSPNEGCQVTISFDPRRNGAIAASVIITHNGSGGSQRLDFQGEGINPHYAARQLPADVLERQFAVQDQTVIH